MNCKFLSVLFALAVSVLFLSACSDAKVEKKQVLTVVTEATFPPYEFRDQNQNIVGIDIDICRAVADKLGAELKVEDTKFDSVIAHVVNKKADIAASGITVTEERKRKVLFTDPYVKSSQLIIVPIKNEKNITGPDSLKNNMRIGCQAGTTAYDYVRQNIILDKNSNLIQQFDNGILAVEALKADKLDAVVLDEGPARDVVAKNDKAVKCLDIPLTSEEYAIVIHKENVELCKAFNEVLADLKKSGKLEEIFAKNKALSDSLKKTDAK